MQLPKDTSVVRARLILAAGIVLVLAGAVLYSSRGHQQQHRIAPDFTLSRLDGQPLQLSSYRGKVVLLDFWATWCDPCREEIPHLVEMQQKYGGRGLQIIGVSMDDSADPVRPFYQQFHMNYPVVMGTAKTGEMYGGVLGLPIAFFITRDGTIAAKRIGAQAPDAIESEIQKLL
jgi:cytochrome c biogenesis protein CcmG, thiol:disulfide interchange protein DsbE